MRPNTGKQGDKQHIATSKNQQYKGLMMVAINNGCWQ